MNKIIGLKELRENTEPYIKNIKKGQSFIVIRKSKPIFKLSPVDEWGDDGIWEQVIDFTKISKKGVAIEKVIKALEELNEQDKKVSK